MNEEPEEKPVRGKPENIKVSALALIVLLCGIGFAPYATVFLVAGLGAYYEWAQVYMNECVAWTGILGVAQVAALILIIRNFRREPIFLFVLSLLPILGIYFSISSLMEESFSSSKLDSADLTLFKFWLGGGFLSAVYIVPLFLFYLAALFVESRSRSFASVGAREVRR